MKRWTDLTGQGTDSLPGVIVNLRYPMDGLTFQQIRRTRHHRHADQATEVPQEETIMAETNIEWADETWNPIVGCSKVSSGCAHCYAEKMAKRLSAMAGATWESGEGRSGRLN